MAHNKGDSLSSNVGKVDSVIKEGQKLFYVHIPQDSSVDSSRVLLKSRAITPSTQGLSFSTKITSFPTVITTSTKDSKSNLRDVSSMDPVKIPKICAKTTFTSGTPIQGATSSTLPQKAPTSSLPIRPMIKSPITVTLTNNRTVTTIFRSTSGSTNPTVVITPARNTLSLSEKSGTAITFVSSSNSTMTPLVCSPSPIRVSPSTQVLAKSSKPLLLHPKILTGSKKDATNTKTIPQKLLPVANSVHTTMASKPNILYGPIPLPVSAPETALSPVSLPTSPIKREPVSLQKRDSYFNSFTPPPLILQSGTPAASKSMQNKSGTTTISIVTGKSSGSPNNVSIVPIQRSQISKPNMLNFKITNGQIQKETVKMDNLLLEKRPLVMMDSSVKRSHTTLETQCINKKFFQDLKEEADRNKDILQEAMSAVASDMQEVATEQNPTSESNSIHSPFDSKPSVDGPKKQPEISEMFPVIVSRNSSSPNTIPFVMATTAVGIVPVVTVSSIVNTNANTYTKAVETPCYVSVPASESNDNSVLNATQNRPDRLIIKTDSVTVRRKITKDDMNEASHLDEDISSSTSSKDTNEEKYLRDKTASDAIALSSALNCLPNELEHQSDESLKTPSEISKLTDSSSSPLENKCDSKDNKTTELLEWQNGLGCLTGTEIKFRINEFDAIELIEDKAFEKVKENLQMDDPNLNENPKKEVPDVVPTVEQNPRIHHSRKASFKGLVKDDSSDSKLDSDGNRSNKDLYDICCCKNCGCYGLSSEFLKENNNNFCTKACTLDYEQKENEWNKEKLRAEKMRRNKKTKIIDKEVQEIKTDEQLQDVPKDPNTSEIKNERPSSGTAPKFLHSWMDTKSCFSWVRYLEHCSKGKGIQTKAAPLKLWSDPFPYSKNLFKPGMKLEGIDPQHQSLFCVMTVMDIIGYRIRLHIDGYSEMYDFWCNADSPFIFQAGWCEKNGRKLESPPEVVNFSWKLYLEHCKAYPAPKQGFFNKNSSSVSLPNSFRVGMKLEAENKKNNMVCVATIADVLDSKILVQYDGWDKACDMWFEVNSPYIHPMGWCQENNRDLQPPQNYSNIESFSWPEYLQETNSMAVPGRAFKVRQPKDFKVDMKLEAVDKRNSMLIRVASISEVKDHKIKLHFDGWDEIYDYWVDDDSSDIHPHSWCYKTGHPLQPPLTPEQCAEDVDSGVTCGTPGCKGFGHIKGLVYNTHHTAYGCPYSTQNINKDLTTLIPDRLEFIPGKKKTKSKKPVNLDSSLPEPSEAEEETQKKRVRKRRKFFDELSPPEVIKSKMPRVSSDESIKAASSFTKGLATTSQTVSLSPTLSNLAENIQSKAQISLSKTPPREESLPKIEPVDVLKEPNIDTLVHQSIFNPGYNPKPAAPLPQSWKKHRHIIPGLFNLSRFPLKKLSSRDIAEMVKRIPGCEAASSRLISQEIDGESLLLINQEDLVQLLQIKLGPAIKIMTLIFQLRNLYGS